MDTEALEIDFCPTGLPELRVQIDDHEISVVPIHLFAVAKNAGIID